MVTGAGPQAKVMTPPAATAATTAAEVQLAAVPVPTTLVGWEVSAGRASAGIAAWPLLLPATAGDAPGFDDPGDRDAAAPIRRAPAGPPDTLADGEPAVGAAPGLVGAAEVAATGWVAGSAQPAVRPTDTTASGTSTVISRRERPHGLQRTAGR
jgi:hypothetical protein